MTLSLHDSSLLYSDLANDPDLGEIVEMFVDEMAGRVCAFREAFRTGDDQQLQTLAHQLKGAAGSYGFATLTPAACLLECAARDRVARCEIEQHLEVLVDLCTRTRAGNPNEQASASWTVS